jgi:anti-anti-sigma regulatory factor
MATHRIVVDLGSLGRPDADIVGTLALLELVARSGGIELVLRNSGEELKALIDFMGLARVLRSEPGRQAEKREEAFGIEKEGELDDSTRS